MSNATIRRDQKTIPHIGRLCSMDGCYKSAVTNRRIKGASIYVCQEHSQPIPLLKKGDLWSIPK